MWSASVQRFNCCRRGIKLVSQISQLGDTSRGRNARISFIYAPFHGLAPSPGISRSVRSSWVIHSLILWHTVIICFPPQHHHHHHHHHLQQPKPSRQRVTARHLPTAVYGPTLWGAWRPAVWHFISSSRGGRNSLTFPSFSQEVKRLSCQSETRFTFPPDAIRHCVLLQAGVWQTLMFEPNLIELIFNLVCFRTVRDNNSLLLLTAHVNSTL